MAIVPAHPEGELVEQSPETATPSISSSDYYTDASARVGGGGDKSHEIMPSANDNGVAVDAIHSLFSSSINNGSGGTAEARSDNEKAPTDQAPKQVTNAPLQEQSDSAVFNTWCEHPPSLPEEKASEPRTPTGTTSPEKQMTPKKPPYMSPCIPAVLGLQYPSKSMHSSLPISASKASMPPAEQPRLQGFERNYSHAHATKQAPIKQSITSVPVEGIGKGKEIIGNETEPSQKRATSIPDTVDRINHGLDSDFSSSAHPRNFNSHFREDSKDIRDYEHALEAEFHAEIQQLAEQDQAEDYARELAELAEEHEREQVRLEEAAEHKRARDAEVAEAKRLQEQGYYSRAKIYEDVLKRVPAGTKHSKEILGSNKAADNGSRRMPKKPRTPTVESLMRWAAANPEEDLQEKIMDQYERRGVLPPADSEDIPEESMQSDGEDAEQMPDRTAQAVRDPGAAILATENPSNNNAPAPGEDEAARLSSSAHTTIIKDGQAAAPHDAEVESASQSQSDADDDMLEEEEEIDGEEMDEEEEAIQQESDTAEVAKGFEADYPDATFNEIVNTQQGHPQDVPSTEPAASAVQNNGQADTQAADNAIASTSAIKPNGFNPTPSKFEDLIPPALEKLDTATLEAQCEALNSHYDGLLAQLLDDWEAENQKMQQWLIRGNDVQIERAWCTVGGAVGDAQKKYLKASKGRKHLAEFARRMADVQRMLLIQQHAGTDDAYSSDMELDH